MSLDDLTDFLEIQKNPNNMICADCGKSYPQWASTNLGVFLCIKCAGIHRSLGTQISKVKSLKLDIWTKENTKILIKYGNEKSNLYFENKLSKNFIRPTWDNGKDIENFIKEKYIQRKYSSNLSPKEFFNQKIEKKIENNLKNELPTFDLIGLN